MNDFLKDVSHISSYTMLFLLLSVSYLIMCTLLGMFVGLCFLDHYMAGCGPGAMVWMIPIMGFSCLIGGWLGYLAMGAVYYIHPSSPIVTVVIVSLTGAFTQYLAISS